jgi:hypothetical protein
VLRRPIELTHSALAYRTPIEFELAYESPSIPA